jgi:hypothetical protein
MLPSTTAVMAPSWSMLNDACAFRIAFVSSAMSAKFSDPSD